MSKIHIDDTLVLNSDLQSISTIEKLIDNQSAIGAFNEDVYGKLLLSVVEAMNNAIVHGNNFDPNKKVTVHYVIEDNQVEYTISNEGEEFDPDSLPDPTAPENLEKESGRGIFVMRMMADEVEYSNGGRTVTLRFNTESEQE